jgi:arylsulfatase A-like enzyme
MNKSYYLTLFLILGLTVSLASVLSLIVTDINRLAFAQSSAGGEKPNFLVIVGDDLGYSDIGPFGSEISTPNLDMIANDGKVLTDYHTAPTCSPGRVALLTGVDWHVGGIGTMYELIVPNQVGKPGYETYINDRVVTVAELLRDAGYNTMQSGKWHLSGEGGHPGTFPYDRGFSNAFTLLQDGGNHYNDREYVPGWPVTFVANDTKVDRPGNGTVYSNTLYTDKLLEFFNKTSSENKPFFAYLAFQVGHTPFQAPPEFIAKYDKIYSDGWDKIRDQRFEKQKELGFWPSNMTDPGRLPPNQAWDSLTNDQKSYAARILAVHAAAIEDMDKNIGRVIQYLKDTGQYDNTFILFTSDNGSSEPFDIADVKYASGVNLTQAKTFVLTVNNSLSNLGNQTSDFNYGPWGSYVAVSPLSGSKTSFYEGGTRPPLVIKEPQTTSPNSNTSGENLIKTFVYVTDITPTILDLANVSHTSTYKGHEVHPLMGKSWNPLLEGTVDKVYADNETIPLELFNQTSVRMGDWKGLHEGSDKEGVWRLYNLANDPGENTNVADQHPDIVQTIKAAYANFAKDVGVVVPTTGAFATLFPAVTANNTQTVNLTAQLVPGYWKSPQQHNPTGTPPL